MDNPALFIIWWTWTLFEYFTFIKNTPMNICIQFLCGLIFFFFLDILLDLIDFLVNFTGFSVEKIMSSANWDNFTTSFPVWKNFVSFSCLIVLSGMTNTVLNRSSKSRHQGLVYDLIKKGFHPFTNKHDISYAIFIDDF